MNLLTGTLPQTVAVCGREYPIHTDFRNWIEFDLTASDPEIAQEQKLLKLIRLCYKELLPPDLQSAIQAAFGFYAGGIERPKTGAEGAKQKGRVYSFDYDADYIYSAFLSEYGINLDTADLHWYQFQALFKSLGEDCMMVKIMGYRSMDLSQIKDKDQRSFYRKMKKQFELPCSKTEAEKVSQIEEALLNGGDLSGIL